jgi:hypothetical protein
MIQNVILRCQPLVIGHMERGQFLGNIHYPHLQDDKSEQITLLLLKNYDLLFRCLFRQQVTPKMAVFQQLPSSTLPHFLPTHQLA